MSSVQLLDKTRKIGKLLHNNNSSKVVFSDICKVMREILNSNVLVISRKGKVLGVGKSDGIEPITELLDDSIGGFIDPMLNERLPVSYTHLDVYKRQDTDGDLLQQGP